MSPGEVARGAHGNGRAALARIENGLACDRELLGALAAYWRDDAGPGGEPPSEPPIEA